MYREAYRSADDVDLKAITKNGRIYGIPKAIGLGDDSPVLWVRKDWMEKLNLEEPTCIDDIAKIARAFMEGDPDGNGEADTIGIPLRPLFQAAVGGTGSTGDIFANYGANTGEWMEKDGEIVYGSLVPEAEQALELLNAWYKEGLIPKDFGSWDRDTFTQAVTSGKAGMFFGPWWNSWGPLKDTVLNDPNADWVAYALPKEPGEDYISGAMNPACSGIGVVSKKCADPSMFFYAINDFLYAQEADCYPADLEEYATVSNNYTPALLLVAPLFADAIIATGVLSNQYVAGEITMDELKEKSGADAAYNKTMADAAKVVSEHEHPTDCIDDWANAVGYTQGAAALHYANVKFVRTLYSGTAPTMEKKMTFLDKLESEAYTKMIMGDTDGKSIAEYFDDFVAQYLEQGGADIQKEVAEAVSSMK